VVEKGGPRPADTHSQSLEAFIMPDVERRRGPYTFLRPVSKEQLAAIGAIAVEGAALEHALEWAIWKMLGLPDDIGELLTTGQNFPRKVNTFKQAAYKRFEDPALRKEADEIAARTLSSSRRRNDVIHASWDWDLPEYFPDTTEQLRAIASIRKLGKGPTETRELAADVPALVQIAAELHSDFLALVAFITGAGLDPDYSGAAGDEHWAGEP
jgi:hypothetical protein